MTPQEAQDAKGLANPNANLEHQKKVAIEREIEHHRQKVVEILENPETGYEVKNSKAFQARRNPRKVFIVIESPHTFFGDHIKELSEEGYELESASPELNQLIFSKQNGLTTADLQ